MNQLPIDHLSYSAMRTFCANPWQFKKTYILGMWDVQSSSVAVVGKGFHKFAELLFRGESVDVAQTEAMKFIDKIPDSEIDFGKTGSRQAIITSLNQVIGFFLQERPVVGKVLGTEVKVTTNFMIGNMQAPVPLKAVSDLVSETGEELWIWDWKVVTSLSDTEEEKPDRVMQAMFNYETVKAKYGKAPTGMRYFEVKKSKNKDGQSQCQAYDIVFDKHPEYFNYFTRMYSGVVRALANPEYVFLPNFSDQFTAEESWADFTAEVMDFEQPKQVSHKSPMQRNVEPNYVESIVDSAVDNLTDSERIRTKLLEFGVPVEMVDSFVGANVTMYRLKPSRGVAMSKITKFQDDLALALGAKSVRIEAPLRGTKYVGVEVSNQKQDVVPWTESLMIEGSLNLPIGADVYGKPYHIDLAKAPHLLVAGSTGSGKSVALNIFIETLMKQNSQDNLGMILVDPKRTEFTQFEGSDHLLSQEFGVITESEDANMALLWAVEEMESRYRTLREARVRDIDTYIANGGYMKKIVIVVDELADLMLSKDSSTIENSIIRLAQKARASGIHLILATQRPSVDVVTGVLKANFPTRIAFMTASRVDSTVILDQQGAESLIGNGDCLVMKPGEKGLVRLQGYYL